MAGRLLTASRGGVSTTMTYDLTGHKLTMSDPDMGNWAYSYDALGNLLTQTDARDCTLSMQYDTIGLLTSKNSSGGGCGIQVSAGYGYNSWTNGIGRRTRLSTQGVTAAVFVGGGDSAGWYVGYAPGAQLSIWGADTMTYPK